MCRVWGLGRVGGATEQQAPLLRGDAIHSVQQPCEQGAQRSLTAAVSQRLQIQLPGYALQVHSFVKQASRTKAVAPL